MNFEPDSSRLEDDCVVLFALMDVFFTKKISRNSFAQFQYIDSRLSERATMLLAEKLLSVAIRLRYLDDRVGFLSRFDRKQVSVENVLPDPSVEFWYVRWALNKIIHQVDIFFHVEKYSSLVFGDSDLDVESGGVAGDELFIRGGIYEDEVVVVDLKGRDNKSSWHCKINLTVLINEVLRVLHKARFNSGEQVS